jgi:hypothetical protein
MKTRELGRIGQLFADGRAVDAALRLAFRDAVRVHKRHNVPLVLWRDGRITLVPAEQLMARPRAKVARQRKPVRKRSR